MNTGFAGLPSAAAASADPTSREVPFSRIRATPWFGQPSINTDGMCSLLAAQSLGEKGPRRVVVEHGVDVIAQEHRIRGIGELTFPFRLEHRCRKCPTFTLNEAGFEAWAGVP